MAKVGLAFSLIKKDLLRDLPLDCIAELDSEKTIQAVADALRSAGHEVIELEADENFGSKLLDSCPEIVFNIAEGVRGDSRESQVPAICEFYGIPYTGSSVLTLTTCLHKARTNEVLESHNVLIPPYQVFYTCDDAFRLQAEFPLIVKLIHEGSSMGLSGKSVVENETELREQVEFLVATYHQPALVQKFILGREFNVGILGNRDPLLLPVTEVVFQDPHGIVVFSPDEEVYPLIAQVRGEKFLKDFQAQLIPHQSICPAKISPELTERIQQTALKAFRALECRDWGRVDMRYSDDDHLYVLELNPIAGLAPGYWISNSAAAINLDYAGFINMILDIALVRLHDDHQF